MTDAIEALKLEPAAERPLRARPGLKERRPRFENEADQLPQILDKPHTFNSYVREGSERFMI